MKTFHALKSYYEVPVDVLEDDAELCRWAKDAVAVHRRKKSARRSR
jgi:TfoX/Sxy family transcriptional regulator of competence genes